MPLILVPTSWQFMKNFRIFPCKPLCIFKLIIQIKLKSFVFFSVVLGKFNKPVLLFPLTSKVVLAMALDVDVE